MRVLVTGGAGFIGSNLVRKLLDQGETILNLDKLTYAGNLASLADVIDHPQHKLRQVDLCNADAVDEAFNDFEPNLVIHLAAETHVDRSIDSPRAFTESNVVGTGVLLEASRRHWQSLRGEASAGFRLLHASTDEVYGSLNDEGKFTEGTQYDPHSPYAATKAASDHLARAWRHTYGLPVIITNCSNNYGPYQFPEKLIPATIVRALAGEPIPVYGSGENVRDWIHVDDHCRALWAVVTKGVVGETYNIGASNERRNIDLVRDICDFLDEMEPRRDGHRYANQIQFVADRPGHDFRYAVDAAKIRRELGWQPEVEPAAGLRQTVAWFLDHEVWRRALAGAPAAVHA